MKRPRRAFTLVELLVVIAIMGILMGMMFPALGAMHESARRATCQGRMAQLGLALQKHEAAYGTLPAGTTDPKSPIHNVPQGIQISWTVRLLPYLDEGPTLKHVDLAAGVYAEKNALVRNLQIAAFACPSQSTGLTVAAPASNYAGCQNDTEQPITEDNHGVLFLNSHISERDVTDGVEHTIYLGEKRVDDGDLGWMSGSRATLRNAGTPINETPTELPLSPQAKQQVSEPPPKAIKETSDEPPAELDADEAKQAAETPLVLPPNPRTSDLYVGGFGSHHPSGMNFLFGDGAVRFVHYELDKGIFQKLANRADGQLLTSGPTRGN